MRGLGRSAASARNRSLEVDRSADGGDPDAWGARSLVAGVPEFARAAFESRYTRPRGKAAASRASPATRDRGAAPEKRQAGNLARGLG